MSINNRLFQLYKYYSPKYDYNTGSDHNNTGMNIHTNNCDNNYKILNCGQYMDDQYGNCSNSDMECGFWTNTSSETEVGIYI